MNGISIFVATFLIYIVARGELSEYAKLIQLRDVNGTKPSNGAGAAGDGSTPSGSTAALLPELPNLGYVPFIGQIGTPK